MTQEKTDDLTVVRSIMKDVRTAMITTTTADGTLHTHPMTTQEAEFDGDAWFILSRSSETARNAAARPHVNVSFSGTSSWLSLAGTAELVDDRAKLAELWNRFVEAWFPGGRTTPTSPCSGARRGGAVLGEPGTRRHGGVDAASSITKNPPSTGDSETVTYSATETRRRSSERSTRGQDRWRSPWPTRGSSRSS